MEESKDFYWAQLASGDIDYIGTYYEIESNVTFNMQLRYWVEALIKFQNLYVSNFKVEELLLILDFLCHSLETLAGVNIIPPANDFTPSLMNLYKESLRNDRGWNLKFDKPDLFKSLEEMNNYHNNLCKHINRSNSRKELLKQINLEKIRKYMNTAKNIWLWLLNKKYKGQIPNEQLQFFEYDFHQF